MRRDSRSSWPAAMTKPPRMERLWAIQSQTQHLSLGFDPEVPVDPKQAGGSRKREHQFLNVG